ncbi:MAG: SpoIID/LytB domain-containing protein, partial [Clostridia bacterium]|nr:SpoIID/LytB domain-containing protein [Clostridia bacterium]
MKKFIVFLTIVSLIFAAVPTTLGAKPTTDTLRVGLYYGSTAKTSYSITSESGFSVGTETDRIYTEQFTMSDTSLTITMGSDGIATFGDRTFDCNNIRLTFKPAGDSSIAVDGNKYRGGLEFLHAGEGKIAVINLVLADEYVYGVTGKEMSASWHLEALKAQSVCARNYALASLNKHSTYGFDVCTTTDCQVYGGIDAEHTNTIRAGMETAGKYLMYNGRLAETLFFSCSGGHT